ncbi:MAG: acetyl-CoA carboxylase biotin carboxyl carrier protein [Alphaproteobacteria bacterium]|nr:acetyl-CoA carboxylase biotin carboxyl carrier protein [Alphaproteobacteria bacterium]
MSEKTENPPPSVLRFSFNYVSKLAALIDEHHLNDIEVHDGESKLLIRRAAPSLGAMATSHDVVQTMSVPVMPVPPPAPSATVVAAPASGEPSASTTDSSPPPAAAGHVITSPMVGTAYLSPEPGAAQFVNTGDKIDVGTPLLIVEAMKMMNQITSETSGAVLEVLVSDGQPVEYGQPLVRIG